MTIRALYSGEPNFPASRQHPDAIRYRIGEWWVDADGPAPTQADIDEFRFPAAQVAEKARQAEINAEPSRVELLDKLTSATGAQIETFVRNKIDADSATDLAAAKVVLKKIETAIVNLTLLVATDNREDSLP